MVAMQSFVLSTVIFLHFAMIRIQDKNKMRKPLLLLLLSLGFVFPVIGQTIKVQPYLQNASPNSIYILWETDEGDESTVEWGITETLGNTTSGTSIETVGTARVHEVKLEGLDRFTRYYYRVKTGTAFSEVFKFKTPPFASDNESFRLIAMSDMQRDGNNPDKFSEIVNDGIIPYLEDEAGGELSDNLAFVMIPGDLVENGPIYSQWEEHFFTPAQNLFNQVPVYPVPGNHENNTEFFFQYFHLPDNGTPDFEEHWWYSDYGNVRIVGLDSNSPYTSQEQLDWLENVLSETCSNDSIDFVFAQMHHPFKSEMWLPGEINYTGEIISQLENFSTNCGKPSIHFFGHTHGYSRGQSRDHKHLWINVATAGGAIDYWDAFPQFDYDEFSVSEDEYGFVSVEISSGDEPQFVVKRISRGDEFEFKNNEITDSMTVKANPEKINPPSPIFPIDEVVRPECVILKATDFSSVEPDGLHGQSHWQISSDCGDFSDPIVESWKNHQNIYFDEDTQEGDDLADEKIIGLPENTDYCWRVRYRDRELNWSNWSQPVTFSTGASQFSPNLVINPGAESDLFQWTVVEGITEALTDGECNGISPHTGEKYFAVGGVCTDGAYGKCIQNINVAVFADSIDAGNLQVNYGGYLSNYGGSDLPAMRLLFLSDAGAILDSTAVLSTLSSEWIMFSDWAEIPVQTRIIQFELTGTRNSGADNDSYFDDLFVRVGNQTADCDEYVTSVKQVDYSAPTLEVIPNPWSGTTSITIPNLDTPGIEIVITNIMGQKVSCPFQVEQNKIILERGNLSAGAYFFFVRNGTKLVGNGKFIVN
jgi:Calcineurin-like phosphoesterase/Purple acid Phosphatase, N-terminal domain